MVLIWDIKSEYIKFIKNKVFLYFFGNVKGLESASDLVTIFKYINLNLDALIPIKGYMGKHLGEKVSLFIF